MYFFTKLTYCTRNNAHKVTDGAQTQWRSGEIKSSGKENSAQLRYLRNCY